MTNGRGVVAPTWRKGDGWRALPAGRKALVAAGAAMLLLAAASAGAQAGDVLGIAQPLTVLLQSLMIAAVPLAGIGLIFLCIGWWVGNQALILGGLGVAALGGAGDQGADRRGVAVRGRGRRGGLPGRGVGRRPSRRRPVTPAELPAGWIAPALPALARREL